MSYKDEYHPRIKSDLKKLDKKVAKEIHDVHLGSILDKPYGADPLYDDLKGVYSYHFRMNKVDYRITYTIDEEKQIVYFVMIAKRENYYDMLKRRMP